MKNTVIIAVRVDDVRFPTSQESGRGSDALHVDPDYSCAYVQLDTDSGIKGIGLAFTLGKGTEIIVAGVKALEDLVVGKSTNEIFCDFGNFWRSLASHSQLRWLGSSGSMRMSCGAVSSALWDLWAKLESKPLWKLLVDLSPAQLVSALDFTYIEDVISQKEAIEILEQRAKKKEAREKELFLNGYPAYTTEVGWLGYTDEQVVSLCKGYLKRGFDGFKVKVGRSLEDDLRRLEKVRQVIGPHNHLMIDANQAWGVKEAIDWCKALEKFKITWIEEPTSPDDVIGHAKIAKELEPLGIGVATGEMAANKVMFKQLLQEKAIRYCQVDATRLAGPNEILPVYFMAHKLNVSVCPHAGGVGLCEMVQHLQMWDFVSLSGSTEDRWIEHVDAGHEAFLHPPDVRGNRYFPPKAPGYSTEMDPKSVEDHKFPNGSVWTTLFKKGVYKKPKCH